jgi:hypothetical protein
MKQENRGADIEVSGKYGALLLRQACPPKSAET